MVNTESLVGPIVPTVVPMANQSPLTPTCTRMFVWFDIDSSSDVGDQITWAKSMIGMMSMEQEYTQ